MALTIEQSSSGAGTLLHLAGELDTNTAPQMRPVIDALKADPPAIIVLNLKALTYMSSAGLRCVFQLKKLMKSTGGEFLVSEPSAQVRKVFEIVKAVPLQSVFSSAQELDAYLDRMQKQVDKPG